jgi:hypothetical protein
LRFLILNLIFFLLLPFSELRDFRQEISRRPGGWGQTALQNLPAFDICRAFVLKRPVAAQAATEKT